MNGIHICMMSVLIASSFPANERRALLDSLDPSSIAEHAAFYDLYKTSPEGREALNTLFTLMNLDHTQECKKELLFACDISSFLLLAQGHHVAHNSLSEEAIALIDQASQKLANRALPGFTITSRGELLALKSSDIDITEALGQLLLSDPQKRRQMRAMVDLMALQIACRLPKNSTAHQKIDAINTLLFMDMGFRFPPQSTFQENIDIFSLLPSVVNERRGVCLGISILYLALAQRLDLPLEIVTPPGHIYLRYQNRNIEPTMRGVHIADSDYLGINCRFLYLRQLKEVLGLSFINQASLSLTAQDYEKAYMLYKEAALFIKDDALLYELTGTSLYMMGKREEAKQHLKASKTAKSDSICQNSLVDDILQYEIPQEAIKPLFLLTTDKRSSILAKKEALESTLAKHPQFRSALFHLALCYLELDQPKDAIKQLEKRSALLPRDTTVEYLLSCLYLQRNNIPAAKQHLENALSTIPLRSMKIPQPIEELQYTLYYNSPYLQNSSN